MTLTTIPTYVITMILFIVLGLSVDINGDVNIEALLTDIEASFTITLAICGACDCYWQLLENRTLNCFIIWNVISEFLQYYFNPTSSNCWVEQMTFSLLTRELWTP
jgi:NhaC family Na+:H+ antiporter